MKSIFEGDETEVLILIEASNAFNLLSHMVTLHNVYVLCTQFSPILIILILTIILNDSSRKRRNYVSRRHNTGWQSYNVILCSWDNAITYNDWKSNAPI